LTSESVSFQLALRIKILNLERAMMYTNVLAVLAEEEGMVVHKSGANVKMGKCSDVFIVWRKQDTTESMSKILWDRVDAMTYSEGFKVKYEV